MRLKKRLQIGASKLRTKVIRMFFFAYNKKNNNFADDFDKRWFFLKKRD